MAVARIDARRLSCCAADDEACHGRSQRLLDKSLMKPRDRLPRGGCRCGRATREHAPDPSAPRGPASARSAVTRGTAPRRARKCRCSRRETAHAATQTAQRHRDRRLQRNGAAISTALAAPGRRWSSTLRAAGTRRSTSCKHRPARRARIAVGSIPGPRSLGLDHGRELARRRRAALTQTRTASNIATDTSPRDKPAVARQHRSSLSPRPERDASSFVLHPETSARQPG